MRKSLLYTVLFVIHFNSAAQEKSPVKFGKISADDFKNSVYSIDSNAAAVVIADIGSSQIVGNTNGWFSLEYRHYKRVHILKKNGYDIANVEIPLYTNGKLEEELQNLKAITYNLENGKITDTRLDVKNSVFKDKIIKNLVVKKFTFPAIREGSIIEFDYTIKSDFLFNLQPWEFQGSYPRLWSEYTVSLPEFLNYVFLTQGERYNYKKEQKDKRESFYVSDNSGSGASKSVSITAAVTDHRYIMKNIPALKEESYTSTLKNHIARVEFQLAEYRYPLEQRKIMGSWPDVCKELLNDEDFGLQLSRDNSWLADDVMIATKGKNSGLERAIGIFRYLQNNITCTDYSAKYLTKPIKNLLKEKKGNVAEINLLLVAMLRKAGLAAYPVILSTKSNGYTYAIYPIMDRFNYVICLAEIDGKSYYLDASHPRLGFGKLDWECYNGHARVVNEQATPLNLSSDSLREEKLTFLFITHNEKGEPEGKMKQTPGYYESYSLRERVKEKGMDELISSIKKHFGADIDINNFQIDSLDIPDEKIQLGYDIKLKFDDEDIIYLNPMFGEGYKENPFKSAERTYPVEMPYAMDETYVLRMEVPQGYQVDELPQSIRLNLDDEGSNSFEYIIDHNNGMISLRSRIKLKRSYFLPEEYAFLREFFSMIVSKQNEQIVFKRKSKT